MPNGPALVPQPWHLAEPPPPLPPSTAPPLLLLLHRDQPLPEGQRAALALSLSPAERQRLSAYRRPADQERFLLARASLRVKIPMSGAVESLNVAAAAAVCLFETARQRSSKSLS